MTCIEYKLEGTSEKYENKEQKYDTWAFSPLPLMPKNILERARKIIIIKAESRQLWTINQI